MKSEEEIQENILVKIKRGSHIGLRIYKKVLNLLRNSPIHWEEQHSKDYIYFVREDDSNNKSRLSPKYRGKSHDELLEIAEKRRGEENESEN